MREVLALLVTVALSFASAAGHPEAQAAHFSVRRPVDRARRTFRISVQRGGCVVGDGEVADTYAGADVSVEPHAYVVTAKVENETSGACAGVGLADLREELRLPRRLGSRALISVGGEGNFDVVLVPPRGRAAIRELVDPKRHPGTIYTGPACAEVESAFRGVPKSTWCFY